MSPPDDATIGERVAYFRRRRGLSQSVLAGLVGKTERWLQYVESGARPVDRLSTIVELARALRLDPWGLLGKPFIPPFRPGRVSASVTLEYVPEIRATMMRHNGVTPLLGIVDRQRPVDLDDVRRRVSHAFSCSQTERWSELGPLLPDLLDDVHYAVSEPKPSREALRLHALAYRVTSGMLDRIGELDLPWIAAERSAASAERTEDPLLIAGGAWRLAVVLRHAGRITESHDVPMVAADALRRTLRDDSPPASWSVYGSLLLKGAVGAATLGDHVAVRDCLREIDRAAERTGDRNDYWFAFGPANVAIHRVWLDLEMGDPSAAIDAAGQVDHERLPPELAERAASHLITVAWAHYLRRRYRETLDALREVQAVAPEQLVFTARVREMVLGMLRRERASIKADLRALADHIGVAG